MTHKQWFNNVLHLHLVPEEGAQSGVQGSVVESLIKLICNPRLMQTLSRV